MTNKETLKKKIIYRSSHRGSKEMDLLLGGFAKKYIEIFNYSELKELEKLLTYEDDHIYKWYFEKKINLNFPITKVFLMLKNFKL